MSFDVLAHPRFRRLVDADGVILYIDVDDVQSIGKGVVLESMITLKGAGHTKARRIEVDIPPDEVSRQLGLA